MQNEDLFILNIYFPNHDQVLYVTAGYLILRVNDLQETMQIGKLK